MRSKRLSKDDKRAMNDDIFSIYVKNKKKNSAIKRAPLPRCDEEKQLELKTSAFFVSLLVHRKSGTTVLGQPEGNQRRVHAQYVSCIVGDSKELLAADDSYHRNHESLQLMSGNMSFEGFLYIVPYTYNNGRGMSNEETKHCTIRSTLPLRGEDGYLKYESLGFAKTLTTQSVIDLFNLLSIKEVDDFKETYVPLNMKGNSESTIATKVLKCVTNRFNAIIDFIQQQNVHFTIHDHLELLFRIVPNSHLKESKLPNEKLPECSDKSSNAYRNLVEFVQKKTSFRLSMIDGNHRMVCLTSILSGKIPSYHNPAPFYVIFEKDITQNLYPDICKPATVMVCIYKNDPTTNGFLSETMVREMVSISIKVSKSLSMIKPTTIGDVLCRICRTMLLGKEIFVISDDDL